MEWSFYVWLLCHLPYSDGCLTLDRNVICSQAQGTVEEMGQLAGLESVEKVVFENLKWLGGEVELGASAVAMWLLRAALKLALRSDSFRFSITWQPECSWSGPVRCPGWGVMGASTGYFRA